MDTRNQNPDFQQFDHVVEGGLTIKSGILQVLDCFNQGIQLEVELSPGNYGVRIYSMNLDSVKDDDSGDDFYWIEIWPDVGTERVVLKQYQYYTD